MENLSNKYVCLPCMGHRNHYLVSETDPIEIGNREVRVDKIIACCGCDSRSFLTEFIGIDDGKVKYFIIQPKRGEGAWPLKKFVKTDNKLSEIYEQLVGLFNEESRELMCGVILRMLVEGICAKVDVKFGLVPKIGKDGQEKMIKKNDLEGKIFGLAQGGFLTTRNAETLHQLRFMGNQAVHNLDPPTRDELLLGIRIVENALDSIFEIEHIGKELETKRTERKRI